MRQVLLKMGLQPTNSQIDDAMTTVDTSQDGEIQFEEFVAFYKTLEARSGGFSSVFQQYMSQFKTSDTVEESLKHFLGFLRLHDAKGLKHRMEKSGKPVLIPNRELLHPPKDLKGNHFEDDKEEPEELTETERRRMYVGILVLPSFRSTFSVRVSTCTSFHFS